ncbi:hypothetical protein FEM03_17110 [Phragmitibacter flavus]|uniref:PepSY domain-containing protein n=1 Tax=Phragmitibacter flavus TaxID=2576071 RepID=A0A5R8KBI2_9BACT|nr:hypothetical protein [Phragmitibacter flavus]TLD69674.1 hypothetical protein FEM03_17110 [Phragmitibacter flavus]
MKPLLIPAFLFLTIACFGGMRSAPAPYAITSPGGHFVFSMTPGPKGKEYEKGSGICYKVNQDGTFTELWRTSDWYSEDIQLHYDGNVLASVGTWRSGDQEVDAKDLLAVAFYNKGKQVARYKISDLVKDEEKLVYSEGGLSWLEYELYVSPAFLPGEEVFQIKTVDGIRYRFDINTGEIVDSNKKDADSKLTEPGN